MDEIDRGGYYSEPQLADDELIDSFSKSLLKMAKARSDELAEHYPFAVHYNDQSIMRIPGQISAVGACYLSLQFFRGLDGGTIEIYDEDDEIERECRENFNREFRKI